MKLFTMNMTDEDFQQLKTDAYFHGKNKTEYVNWLIQNQRTFDEEQKKVHLTSKKEGDSNEK